LPAVGAHLSSLPEGKERVDAAATYRRKAAQLREKAKGARDPVVHQELLSLAEQYETLAKRAESEAGGKS
jgi:hypothetical protein